MGGRCILAAMAAAWALTADVALGQSLREAKATYQKGNYAEAQEIYGDLAKEPRVAAVATVGLSRALEAEGKRDDALAAVERILKAEPKNVDLLARQAELLYERGRWDDAKTAAQAAVAKKDDCFLARWVLAQIRRDSGDWAKAAEEFRWFVRTYTKRSDADDEIKDAEELHLVGLAALEYARYHHLADQYEFVVTELFVDALKADKLFWRAEYDKGRVFLEKHNKASAAKAFDRALAINPRATPVFVAKAMMAFSQFEMRDAEVYVDQALAVDPNDVDGLRIKAAVHAFSHEPAKASEILAKALKLSPRNESVLAQLAAGHYVAKRTKEFDAVVKEVEAFNPKAWRFYHELGAQLDGQKLFFDSEPFFRKAIDLEPKMPEGYEALGMLYLRLGKEKEARELLREAFDADPFHVRVANSLKVLDHLDRYATVKTPHYVLKHDPAHDEVLARFMLHYLEGLHAELEKKFDFRPKEPYLIEIFNKHEMFSGRVTALPDLHTIGACTGRMMAMVSTHDRSKVIAKPFNWVRVLRHEVVHLFNLDQTRFQCPHWLTEGLAVTLEGKTPPPRWNYLLAEKMRADDLLNLDTILLGFVRPRSPDQWQQAYMQSQLYVAYLTKTHGEPAIGKLLQAFADGADTDRALPKALGVSKAEFEKGYRAFLEDRLKDLKLPKVAPNRTLKELKELRLKTPEDADVVAELAERNLRIGNGREALDLADEALRLKANHPLAAYVKAKQLLAEKKRELALATLVTSVDANATEPRAVRLLGQTQFEMKDFDLAATTFEKGRKLEPFEATWLVDLAKTYVQLKDEPKLMEVLTKVAESDPDDLFSRTKLAAFHDREGNHAEAERYAWEIFEIDVKNPDAGRILLDALKAQKKDEKTKLVQRLLFGE